MLFSFSFVGGGGEVNIFFLSFKGGVAGAPVFVSVLYDGSPACASHAARARFLGEIHVAPERSRQGRAAAGIGGPSLLHLGVRGLVASSCLQYK